MKKSVISICLLIGALSVSAQVAIAPHSNMTAIASECEKAYHNGDVLTLSAALEKFSREIESKNWLSEYDSLEHICLGFKFKSNLAYLSAEYKKAVSCADSSLAYSKFVHSPLYKTNLYIEKTQSQFVLGQYEAAEQSLELAAGTNIPDTTYSDCESARALCLAYQKKFDEASSTMNRLYEDVPTGLLDEDRALERDRRNAKIHILKAESLINPALEDYREAINSYTSYFEIRKKKVAAEFATMTPERREGLWLTQRQFLADCYRLGKHAPSLTYDAALFNKNLLLQFSARNSRFRDCSWKDVRKGLPKNGAAIEFICYRKDSATLITAAVVTASSKNPTIVQIGSLEEIMCHRLNSHLTVGMALVDDSRRAKNELYTDKWLMNTIWNEELRNALSGCKEVYFSADSFLHQLAVEYMYPEADIPEFHRLTSTRSLCGGFSPIKVSDSDALVCADIDFQADIVNASFPGNDSLAFQHLAHRGICLQPLDGSRAELNGIRAARTNSKDSILFGSRATEYAFLKNVGDFKIVHLSTHGFYDGKIDIPVEGLKPHLSDNSLSQSVLFFSGAGRKLSNGSSPSGLADGIVSARELSGLDMTNVELCVLAACQTGLGEVTYDGVYGIQRGLKNAGAGAMVLSLWSVSDAATAILMSSLYRHLSKGDDVHTAFTKSREDLSRSHKKSISRFFPTKLSRSITETATTYDDPFFRDAFILIDDIK